MDHSSIVVRRMGEPAELAAYYSIFLSMLRDKNLIPLSHQHQRALALCVRIDRAQPIAQRDFAEWQREISQLFEQEIKLHFAAEEEILFPASSQQPELALLVEDLIADHAALRLLFARAESDRMSAEDLSAFGQQLSAHIRREERELFEGMQRLMNSNELDLLGKRLDAALKDVSRSCLLSNESTRLRARFND